MTRTITKSNGKWYTVTPRSGFGEACSGGWLEGVTTPEPGDRVMVEYDAMGSYPLPALPDGLKYDNGIVVVKQDEMSNIGRAKQLFERPYAGKDAITGRTMDEFIQHVDTVLAPDFAKEAAINICRAYNIRGLCDPGYIANVIMSAYTRHEE